MSLSDKDTAEGLELATAGGTDTPATETSGGGSPPGTGPTEHIIIVDGPDRPSRKLTVDFAAFTQKILDKPELDQQKLSRYTTGVDLIDGLYGPPDASFGSATAGIGKEAELSEQLGAITEEALEAAEEVLEAAHTQEEPFMVGEQFDLRGPVSRELAFALSRLGHSEYSAAHTELLRARAYSDRAVASEFI